MAQKVTSASAIHRAFRHHALIALICPAALFSGCGRTEVPNAAAFRSPESSEGEVVRLDVVDLPDTSTNADGGIQLASGSVSSPGTSAGTDAPEFPRGTPEWLILELAKLQSPATSSDEPTLEISDADRQRLLKMIELATEVVAKTHNDAARQQLFNNAVHYLADARMRLAVAGDRVQGQYLSQEANALFTRDSTGFAAVEAATKLLELTRIQAEKNVGGDPQWSIAFARQSRVFAEKFPQESSRAAVNLTAAAKFCDRAGLHEEARACIALLHDRFSETPFAEQTQGLRRRLELPGHPLTEFGGSTFDGGCATAEQYRGKPLVIAFWASNSAAFQADLATMERTLARYGDRVSVLGVNLDRDEQNVRDFLSRSGNTWKHIFFSAPDKRGERNILAEYYGVTDVPSYWLVDAHGIVRSIQVDPHRLDQFIGEAMSPIQTN